jgi:hypothetical protein
MFAKQPAVQYLLVNVFHVTDNALQQILSIGDGSNVDIHTKLDKTGYGVCIIMNTLLLQVVECSLLHVDYLQAAQSDLSVSSVLCIQIGKEVKDKYARTLVVSMA